MKKDDRKLLKLCLNALNDKNLDQKAYSAFSKDYAKFSKEELTFRELMESVKFPKGELKEAMQTYYDNSQYHRVFKNR